MNSSWQDKNIEVHSTHNKGESVVAKGTIRTLKNNIYKYVTSVSKKMFML